MWPVSEQFKAELRKPVHTVAAKIQFLNTDFIVQQEVGVLSADPNDVLIDGTVDLDVERGTRRTLTMSLLNPEGQFTADSEETGETPDWDGYFYVNRLIRLWRGVRYEDGTEELAPIGTFMVDKSEVLVERSMSTVVIAGSDLWKKFTKSQFGSPTSWAAGTELNTVIEELCTAAGVTLRVLDPLAGRTTASRQLGTTFNMEKDDTRGDALMKLCTDHGLEAFFDPMGVFTTRDFQDPMARPTEWTYDDTDGLAFFLRSVIDDDRLYNHVIVVGTADAQDGGTIYKSELTDADPGSSTNISRIGDRVFRFESPLLGTQEAVDKSATTIFYKHFLLGQTISLEAICNPAIAGNDVLRIVEQRYSGFNGESFLVNTASIPLVTSKQKITMKRLINVTPS